MAEIKINAKLVINQLANSLAEGLIRSGILLERAIKTSMHIGNRGGTFPSRPGEVPHVGTGILRASITYEIDRSSDGIVLRVGAARHVNYAAILESLGGLNRPYLVPALVRHGSTILSILGSV